MKNKFSKLPSKPHGFTLVELLVVMVIIAMLAALLLPALRKARAKATRDKAKNEISAIASAIIMAKQDIGYYVRICDLNDASLSSLHTGYPVANGTTLENDLNGTYTLVYCNTALNDTTSKESEITQGHPWDGPYMVFQPNTVYSSERGSLVTVDGATGWDGSVSTTNLSYGTPLDPWGHPYLVAYNSTDKVMVIYSAGPDGKIQTDAGDKQVPANSDDIVYVFR